MYSILYTNNSFYELRRTLYEKLNINVQNIKTNEQVSKSKNFSAVLLIENNKVNRVF